MFQDRLASLALLIAFVAILWVVQIVNLFMDYGLNQYGLVPRTIEGLRGIPLSPFLHGGFGHLISNSVPLLILGGLVAVRGQANFVGVTLFVVFVGGLAVWCLGRPWPWDDIQGVVHVGASGLVFGYFGYLVAPGLVRAQFPRHYRGGADNTGVWLRYLPGPGAHGRIHFLGRPPVRFGSGGR